MISYKKRFARNLALLLTSRVVNAVLTLLVNLLLIDRLNSSVYGEFAFALTLSVYFILISDTGLSPLGETIIAKNKDNISPAIDSILSARFWLSSISAVIIIAIALFFFKGDVIQRNILIAVAFLPFVAAFNFSWALRGIEKNHIILITSFIGGLFYFLGVFLIVKNAGWYVTAVLLFLGGNIITSALQFGYIRSLTKRIRLLFSYVSLKKTVKDSFPFGVFIWLNTLYISYPIIFLKIFSVNRNIGIYYITYKLIAFIFVIFNLMGNAFIPVISDPVKMNDGKKESNILSKLIRFTYTFSIPVCFGGFVISHSLITELFGAKLIGSAALVRIMIWAIIPTGINSALISYLMVKGEKRKLIKSAGLTSLVGFIFSIFLIKFMGLNGTAYSVVIMETVMAGSLIYFTNKISKIRFDFVNIAKVLSASFLMGYAVYILQEKLILSIVIGTIVYAVLSLILKTLSLNDIKEFRPAAVKNRLNKL